MAPKKRGTKNISQKKVKPEQPKTVRKSARIAILLEESRNDLIEKEQTTENERQSFSKNSPVLEQQVSTSGTVQNAKPKMNVKKSTVVRGAAKTPTPKTPGRFRMSLPKDFFSREELKKTPRKDGLDEEILDYYLNEAYKNSPNYLDLKAKRWNTGFRHETPRARDIIIFTPEEEAEFAEERLRMYGPVPDESIEEAKIQKFAEALTELENLPCNKEDEEKREYYEKLEREIEEEKKKHAKSSKKGKGKKKQAPSDNILLNLDDLFEPDELPNFLGIEKEADLLARWKAECEDKTQKKCVEDEIVAGPSFLSSYDPASEDDPITETPKPVVKKSSVKKMAIMQDEKNVLPKSSKENEKGGKKKLVDIVSQPRKKKTERNPSGQNKKK